MTDHQEPTQEQIDQMQQETVFRLRDVGAISHRQAVAALMPIAARIWNREMGKRTLADEEQPF